MKRFIIVKREYVYDRSWVVVDSTDDLLQWNREHPGLGYKYFDTRDQRWVKPGVRGPKADKNARVQYGEVPTEIEYIADPWLYTKTKEQLKKALEKSDDSLCPALLHKHKRRTAGW